MNMQYMMSDAGAAADMADYGELNMRILTRERQRITRRGRLTEEEDLRLDEIDAELEYWEEILKRLGEM
jgi:hypothetical protein